MTKTIAISNQKGGVGKTTLTVNLAGGLAEKGYRVLILDMDSQGNMTSFFKPESQPSTYTAFDLLTKDDISVKEVIQKTEFHNLDIIPASIKLKGIDSHFAGELDAQFILKDKLQQVKDDYDYILIDCPPSPGLATSSSYVSAHYVFVPVEAQEWALKGLNQTTMIVQKIKNRMNPDLQILGIIVNKFNSQRTIEKEHFELLKNLYRDLIFPMQIKVSVKYPEAVTARKPINHYLPSSEQADTFRKIAEEVEKRCQK